jgi:hypothetical protein
LDLNLKFGLKFKCFSLCLQQIQCYNYNLTINDDSRLKPSCFMNSCVLISGLQLYHEMKYLTQTPSQINCCISCRINDARRRRLRVGLRTRPRVFWRSGKRRRGSNWSSEPKFGSPWHSCPQPHSRRQVPDITYYFIYSAIYIYLYLSMHYVHRNCMRNPSCISLGTNVLYLSPHRLDALLIGPVEIGWFSVTRAI